MKKLIMDIVCYIASILGVISFVFAMLLLG